MTSELFTVRISLNGGYIKWAWLSKITLQAHDETICFYLVFTTESLK